MIEALRAAAAGLVVGLVLTGIWVVLGTLLTRRGGR